MSIININNKKDEPIVHDVLLGSQSIVDSNGVATIPDTISSFINDGDGTSPYATESQLNTKQDELIAGDNITIEDNVISAQVPIAAKEYPGTVYAWTDADGFHLWINDPSSITYDTEENPAGGLTYNIYTLDYTVEANIYGETYIIGE